MTADESGPEAITQGSEMHRDEAKDVQWETVDGGQRVPPFVDGCRSGQDVFGKLGELEKVVFRAQGESSIFSRESRTWSKVKLRRSVKCRSSLGGPTYDGEYAMFFNSALRAKTSCGSERPFPG